MILLKYFTREVFATMLAVTGIVLVVSVGWRFSGYLDDAAAGVLSREVLFLVISYRIPSFLELILPISFFLAVMLTYGRMHVDSEMVVLESCGLSPAQIIRITLLLSLVATAAAGGISLWLKPEGEKRVQQLFSSQRNLTEFDTLAPGRFQTLHSGRRVTYTENFTDEGDLAGVFINEFLPTDAGTGTRDLVTVVAESGTTQVDEFGSRFLVLNDGYRYRGSPGDGGYQVVEYEEYGQLIEREVGEQRIERSNSVPTLALLKSRKLPDIAELQWRLSVMIMIPVIALMAIPLSRVNPRQGRFTRLVPGMILCFLYVLSLSSATSSLARGRLPVEAGILWIHLVFIVITVLLFNTRHITAALARIRRPAT